MSDRYFAVVIPPFGATLLAILDKSNFNGWVAKKDMLTLFEPRRLTLTVSETEPGNANTRVSTLQFGPAHMADTPQDTMYVDQATVEIIGEIEDVGNNQEQCTSNNRLFQKYLDFCKAYKMSRSKLVAPSAQDMISLNNVTKFPKR